MSNCPQCNQSVAFGTSFCGACGFNMLKVSGGGSCSSCGSMLTAGAKFCGVCGTTVSLTAGMPGVVSDGEWMRGDSEWVKRVNIQDMKNRWGSKSVRVPHGTICAVWKEGTVVEVLQAGQQITLGILDNLVAWLKGGADASFYLIDCSPIPFTCSMVRNVANSNQSISIRMQAFLVQPSHQPEQLARFLQMVVKDLDSVSAQVVHGLLHQQVSAVAKQIVSQCGDKFSLAEQQIATALNQQLGPQYGLLFTVSVQPTAKIYTISAQFGLNVVPQTVSCVSCQEEIPLTGMFCGHCATRQPTRQYPDQTGMTMPLISVDNKQMELDVVFQLQGDGDFQQNADLIPAIASAAAGKIRTMKGEDVLSADGLRAIEKAIQEKLILQITGFHLQQIAILDVKDKNGQWVLQARADMERVREQLKINAEWIAVEGEELQLEKLTLDMVLQRQRLHLDQEFARVGLEQEHELRMQDSELRHQLNQDLRETQDRTERQALADTNAQLDLQDATRETDLHIALDAQQRREDRHMAEQDHIDDRTLYARSREVLEQERGDKFADDKVEFAHGAEMANAQLEHDIAMEQKTVAQNIWVQDQQVDMSIRHTEKQAESNAKIDWMQAEMADKKKRLDVDTQLFAQKSFADLQFEDDKRRNDMTESNADAKARREQELLRTQVALDMQIDAQQNQHAQKMREMEQAEKMAEIEANKSIAMNEDRIKSAVDAKAREEADARIALQREMYENMSSKQDAMFERMMRLQEQQAASNRDNSQILANALGGVQQQNRAQQQETIDAYKAGAQQAKEMAQTSMSSMSHVAGVKADDRPIFPSAGQGTPVAQQVPTSKPMGFTPPHQASASPKDLCPSCGKTHGGGKFCVSCGKA